MDSLVEKNINSLEFHSKMNDGSEENPFATDGLPASNPDQAFGSSFNTPPDDDVPF